MLSTTDDKIYTEREGNSVVFNGPRMLTAGHGSEFGIQWCATGLWSPGTQPNRAIQIKSIKAISHLVLWCHTGITDCNATLSIFSGTALALLRYDLIRVICHQQRRLCWFKEGKHDSCWWNVVGCSVSPPPHPRPMGTACSQSDRSHGAISREYKGSTWLLRGRVRVLWEQLGLASGTTPRILFSSASSLFLKGT